MSGVEGAPRIAMLGCEPKYTVASVDFAPGITQYIRSHYGEDPAKFDAAIGEVNNLREMCCRCSADAEGIAATEKYFCQLSVMANRFPMEPGEDAAVVFTWFDRLEKSLDLPNPAAYDDVNFELACVMHNLAALHSLRGVNESRVELESVKAAFGHFQRAAWAFQYCRDKLSAAGYSLDFDPVVLSFYAQLMLAQAQECVVEKSLVDGRRHATIARVAQHAADAYGQCAAALDTAHSRDVFAGRVKEMQRHCELKRHYYQATAYLFMGMAAADEQKMGERLAWYRASAERLNDCIRLTEKVPNTKETIKFVRDVIAQLFENAGKENNFIYHDKVPDFVTLEQIKGVCLVKPIGFDPLDPSVAGPDLFASLLPLPVVKALSVYSEMKAKLLRGVTQSIQAKDEELQTFLSSSQLSGIALDGHGAAEAVPESLLRASAAFHAQPDAVSKVVDALERLASCYKEATNMLGELQQRHADMQAKLETLGDTPLASTARDAFDEMRHYMKAHEQAASNNAELRHALSAHSDDLKLLALPLMELAQHLPQQGGDFETAPETAELRKIMAKVEEMSKQRAELVQKLRDKLDADDVTQRLLSLKHFDSTEVLEGEMKKYEQDTDVIEMNLKAQTNILNALTDANASFALLRQRAHDINQQRAAKVSALVAASDAFASVTAKCEAGRQFYARYLAKLRALDERFDELEEQVDEAKHKADARLAEGAAAAEAARQKRLESERAAALAASAAAAQYSHAPPPPPAAAALAPAGRPRLADYMQYYRAKRDTGDAALPPGNPPGAYAPQPAAPQTFVPPPPAVPFTPDAWPQPQLMPPVPLPQAQQQPAPAHTNHLPADNMSAAAAPLAYFTAMTSAGVSGPAPVPVPVTSLAPSVATTWQQPVPAAPSLPFCSNVPAPVPQHTMGTTTAAHIYYQPPPVSYTPAPSHNAQLSSNAHVQPAAAHVTNYSPAPATPVSNVVYSAPCAPAPVPQPAVSHAAAAPPPPPATVSAPAPIMFAPVATVAPAAPAQQTVMSNAGVGVGVSAPSQPPMHYAYNGHMATGALGSGHASTVAVAPAAAAHAPTVTMAPSHNMAPASVSLPPPAVAPSAAYGGQLRPAVGGAPANVAHTSLAPAAGYGAASGAPAALPQPRFASHTPPVSQPTQQPPALNTRVGGAATTAAPNGHVVHAPTPPPPTQHALVPQPPVVTSAAGSSGNNDNSSSVAKSPWHVGMSQYEVNLSAAMHSHTLAQQQQHTAAAKSQWHCGLAAQQHSMEQVSNGVEQLPPDANGLSTGLVQPMQPIVRNQQAGISLLDEPLESAGPTLPAPLLPSAAK